MIPRPDTLTQTEQTSFTNPLQTGRAIRSRIAKRIRAVPHANGSRPGETVAEVCTRADAVAQETVIPAMEGGAEMPSFSSARRAG
jgi:hypothetical protein